MINITGHTGLTGLLGSPVTHSVSPLMHNEAFRYLGLDYVYLCFDVTEETLPQAVEGLKACGIKGFNLTMPNKNKIVELLDELSPTAQLIGAVNTVRNDNGKLKGFNTDGYGFTQSARDAGCDVKGRTITVMGVALINLIGNLCSFFQKCHCAVTVHGNVSILTEKLHRMADTWLGNAKSGSNINGTDPAALLR